MHTNIWTTSVQITADTPPRTVYPIIAAPSRMTVQVTGMWVTTEITRAVAKKPDPVRERPRDHEHDRGGSILTRRSEAPIQELVTR